ncbi:MAG: hypothetical protein Q8S84_05915 [bacterium]|nr:hypothetical protein [bacterium]
MLSITCLKNDFFVFSIFDSLNNSSSNNSDIFNILLSLFIL